MNGMRASSRVARPVRYMAMRSTLEECEAGNVVPQLVEPQPRLSWIAARLVHHAPLVTGEVLGLGLGAEVGAVLEEQEGAGVVGAVEGLPGDQRGVQAATFGQGQLGRQHGLDRPVVPGRHLDLAPLGGLALFSPVA